MPSFPSGHLLALSDWQSFYVILCSSAAALTGLTFIVITLAADDRDGPGSASARLLGRTLDYKPFASDWVWSVPLPVIAYLGLGTSGLTMARAPSASLYAVSGAAMLLLLIGIHNAWDVVVWMTTERHARRERQRRGGSSRGNPR